MHFELYLDTNPADKTARLKLKDKHGRQVGNQQIRLKDEDAASWEGLFDTRRHVQRYEGSCRYEPDKTATAEDILNRLGVFIGESVVGKAMMRHLAASPSRRTLLLRLPKADEDPLAAAFARVPWEIARSGITAPTLMDKNLIIRAITEDTPAIDPAAQEQAAQIAAGKEDLRILLVFAEAPGSRPLAMRREREALRDLFIKEILPHKQCRIDMLCHGVTKKTIQQKIIESRGYHIIHWSGHGQLNKLEILGEDGTSETITGKGLVNLIREAGGFVPMLVFLSACLSGAFVSLKSWNDLMARLRENETSDTEKKGSAPKQLEEALETKPGYTGTALNLLQHGVPQVVAMRYEVGDDYARELAIRFYRHMLVNGYPTDEALAQARKDLSAKGTEALHFDAVDPATPLIFGHPGRLFEPKASRSPQMAKLYPRPQPLLAKSRELDQPALFVGRSAPLTRLNTSWLTEQGPAIALVQGLAGLGKTMLAAEAIHLWHPRFDYVLIFQAKPHALHIDEFYRGLDKKLTLESTVYRETCANNPFHKIYLEPTKDLTGNDRYQQMHNNLINALRSEAILVVVDNFENNLEDISHDHCYACDDPQWDIVLKALAEALPNMRSRLLVTSRHLPAVLSDATKALWIPLGPLPIGEASIYVRSHPKLSRLLHGGNEHLTLIKRLLDISRGHPLILDRLGSLADQPDALEEALEKLKKEGVQELPNLFAQDISESDRRREYEYLEDVAICSIDLLIRRCTPDARRLLWIITLANEPNTEEMIEGVWSGRSLSPLLQELHHAGLLSKETPTTEESSSVYSFHELTKEGIACWMAKHEEERKGSSEKEIWLAYGERYSAVFKQLLQSCRERSRDEAAEAGRRAMAYIIRAREFERLRDFASMMIINTNDPLLLRIISQELKAAVDEAPSGEIRWCMRTYLADALGQSGKQDQALAFYEQAAKEAEEAEHWADVGWICQNWGIGLRYIGRLDDSRKMFLRSAEAEKKSDSALVDIWGSEMEVLRIDIMQGKAGEVLPEIEKRLTPLRSFWHASRTGKRVKEAPDRESLGRAFITALDIARQAYLSQKNWQSCLEMLKETEQVKKDRGAGELDVAETRYNQYGPLLRLNKLSEAQKVLEECLQIFRDHDDTYRQSAALSALADLWDRRGDLKQAIGLEQQGLSLCNNLPVPSDRAISHQNLSLYLQKTGQSDWSAQHFLAALIYRFVMGEQTWLPSMADSLLIRIRTAKEKGEGYTLPRITDLLANPQFAPLRQWLDSNNRSDPARLQQLQKAVDQFVQQADQAA
ncbi:MAG: CHAT domain-containing protein [bacterium]